MDLVVRRQSEQLGRNFSETISEDDEDGSNKAKQVREISDYRRWEWGNLRVNIVIHIFFVVIYILFFTCVFNL